MGKTIMLTILSVLFCVSGSFFLGYKFGFGRGFGHGKHLGFTEGLFKAQQASFKKKSVARPVYNLDSTAVDWKG